MFFAYFAGYVIPVVDQEPLSGIAEEIKSVIKPGDVVGVASSGISHRRLNLLLEDYKIIRVDKPGRDRPRKGYFINEFLATEDRGFFCLITKDDYYELVDEELRSKLFIMAKTFLWKKFHKQGEEYFKRLLTYFLEGKREKLKQAIKEEIYLLSNKYK